MLQDNSCKSWGSSSASSLVPTTATLQEPVWTVSMALDRGLPQPRRRQEVWLHLLPLLLGVQEQEHVTEGQFCPMKGWIKLYGVVS